MSTTPPLERPISGTDAADVVSLVLVEALGSSMTPFVPLPFVDDYLFARLLRRIARKVIERGGNATGESVAKDVVDGYLREGDPGVGAKAFSAVARFVVRKVAIVLDVKRSHDVFGESIAFALALDRAVVLRAVDASGGSAHVVGGAIYRATQSVGSATLEVITRAGRETWSTTAGPDAFRFGRVAEAIGQQIDTTHGHLDRLMRWELAEAGLLARAD